MRRTKAVKAADSITERLALRPLALATNGKPANGLFSLPGGVVELSTQIVPSAPEGDLREPVTVSGDDGSVAAALVETTVEHPPTVEATIDGCGIKATA